MNGIFKNAESFNQDISSWNVSSVTDMRSMFTGAVSFNPSITALGCWDVSSVTDMNWMFAGAKKFNPSGWLDQEDSQDTGNKWDVSNVINMSYMFYNAKSFGKKGRDGESNIDISHWNVSESCVTEMVFAECPLPKERQACTENYQHYLGKKGADDTRDVLMDSIILSHKECAETDLSQPSFL